MVHSSKRNRATKSGTVPIPSVVVLAGEGLSREREACLTETMAPAPGAPRDQGANEPIASTTPTRSKPASQPRLTTWKVVVLAEVERLRHELARSRGQTQSPPATPSFAPLSQDLSAIDESVNTAEDAARNPRAPWSNWLTGADIDRAWAALHLAGATLLRVQPDESVRAQIPEIASAIQLRLDPTDPRQTTYRGYLAPFLMGNAAGVQSAQLTPSLLSPEDRETLLQMRTASNAASDEAHGRIRSFRNMLLLTGAALALALNCRRVRSSSKRLPPALFQTIKGWLPPRLADRARGSPGRPARRGGRLAWARRLRGPYGLPLTQSLLKVPSGALTGLLGALWLQSGVLGAIPPQTGGKLFAYVAVFGFAQEAFTTFVDGQAGKVLGAAKSPNAAPSTR